MINLIQSFQGSTAELLFAMGLLAVLAVMFSIVISRILHIKLHNWLFEGVSDKEELRIISNKFCGSVEDEQP
jgi:hypothetical protein